MTSRVLLTMQNFCVGRKIMHCLVAPTQCKSPLIVALQTRSKSPQILGDEYMVGIFLLSLYTKHHLGTSSLCLAILAIH